MTRKPYPVEADAMRRAKPLRRDPRPISELALHKNVITLLRFAAKPKVLFFHCPNGEARSARTGAKLKAMGVLPGVADICIVGPRGLVYFLELKRRGKIPSAAQMVFRDRCMISDTPYRAVDNFEDARSQLLHWDLIRPYRPGQPAVSIAAPQGRERHDRQDTNAAQPIHCCDVPPDAE